MLCITAQTWLLLCVCLHHAGSSTCYPTAPLKYSQLRTLITGSFKLNLPERGLMKIKLFMMCMITRVSSLCWKYLRWAMEFEPFWKRDNSDHTADAQKHSSKVYRHNQSLHCCWGSCFLCDLFVFVYTGSTYNWNWLCCCCCCCCVYTGFIKPLKC